LGTILRTEDGGQSWDVVRGEGRRMALFFLNPRQDQVEIRPIVEFTGEEGYRSVVAVVATDEPQSGVPGSDFVPRLNEAMLLAGGSRAQVDWQLSLGIPGIER